MSDYVGQRCFFQIKHICSFGTVYHIDVDEDGVRVWILGDNGARYKANLKDIILLGRKREWN